MICDMFYFIIISFYLFIWKHEGYVVTCCVTCDWMCRPKEKRFVICVGYKVKISILIELYYCEKKIKNIVQAQAYISYNIHPSLRRTTFGSLGLHNGGLTKSFMLLDKHTSIDEFHSQFKRIRVRLLQIQIKVILTWNNIHIIF